MSIVHVAHIVADLAYPWLHSGYSHDKTAYVHLTAPRTLRGDGIGIG